MTYLDNAATTPLSSAVRAAMRDVMDNTYGNPSSLHSLGINAERVIKNADKIVRAILGVTDGDILWTSGGTESNNTAVLGAARASVGRGKRVVTSAAEHPSVAEAFTQLAAEGFEVVVLPVGADGKVSANALAAAVDAQTTLVSVMHVNNETGAVQDIEALAQAAKAVNDGLLFHCDAVQSFCKHSLAPALWGVDLLSASAHKIHGPKGAGILYAKHPARLKPLFFGGGQQKGIRPGTENVIGIAGFAAAAREASADMAVNMARVTELHARLLQIPTEIDGVQLNSYENGSPHIVNLSVDGIRAEVLLHALEAEGFYVSTGSACSSKQKHSQALVNHGYSVQRAESAIRISLSAWNTMDEAEAFCAALAKQVRFLRRYGGVRK